MDTRLVRRRNSRTTCSGHLCSTWRRRNIRPPGTDVFSHDRPATPQRKTGAVIRQIFLVALIGMDLSHAAAAEDGGGRDVAVALFSTQSVHSVTLTPLGGNAWTAHCATCAHEPLTAPLQLTDSVDIFAG